MNTATVASEAVARCNEACGHAIVALVRIIVRVCWGYLHYWTFAIIGPLAAIYGYLRWRLR